MDLDDVYNTIGYIVAVIFFIYLITKALTLNVRVVEGMGTLVTGGSSSSSNSSSSPSNLVNEIKLLQTTEDNLKNSLKIDATNKENYSTLLDSLYSITNYRLLKLILDNSENINSKPDDVKTLAAIKKINETKEFMDTLSFSYKTLDNLAENQSSI